MIIDFADLSPQERYGYLVGAVGPRPVAFASTINNTGEVNLSPFSFFNVFSGTPPILIFSPVRRGRDGSTKNTLDNVIEHPEVSISIVSYSMVQQMSLSSTEYEKGVNEFEKSGFSEGKSVAVQPPFVAEAPISFECKVNEIKSLGENGGAGQLVICEVLKMHIDRAILTEDGKIDPYKLDAIGRLGGDWYSRVSGDAIFEVTKPLKTMGIGVDQIPDHIRVSAVLTGNHLGILGNVEKVPQPQDISDFGNEPEVRAILDSFDDEENIQLELHKLAADLLNEGEVETAWKVLMIEY